MIPQSSHDPGSCTCRPPPPTPARSLSPYALGMVARPRNCGSCIDASNRVGTTRRVAGERLDRRGTMRGRVGVGRRASKDRSSDRSEDARTRRNAGQAPPSLPVGGSSGQGGQRGIDARASRWHASQARSSRRSGPIPRALSRAWSDRPPARLAVDEVHDHRRASNCGPTQALVRNLGKPGPARLP